MAVSAPHLSPFRAKMGKGTEFTGLVSSESVMRVYFDFKSERGILVGLTRLGSTMGRRSESF